MTALFSVATVVDYGGEKVNEAGVCKALISVGIIYRSRSLVVKASASGPGG